MKALSVRQPWAWAILHAGKAHENRTWTARYRGPLLIHASATMTEEDVADFTDALEADPRLRAAVDAAGGITVRQLRTMMGGLVGVVEVVDCVRESSSPWFFGPRAFVLENRRPAPLVPWKGARGLFAVPDDIAARVLDGAAALQAAA